MHVASHSHKSEAIPSPLVPSPIQVCLAVCPLTIRTAAVIVSYTVLHFFKCRPPPSRRWSITARTHPTSAAARPPIPTCPALSVDTMRDIGPSSPPAFLMPGCAARDTSRPSSSPHYLQAWPHISACAQQTHTLMHAREKINKHACLRAPPHGSVSMRLGILVVTLGDPSGHQAAQRRVAGS